MSRIELHLDVSNSRSKIGLFLRDDAYISIKLVKMLPLLLEQLTVKLQLLVYTRLQLREYVIHGWSVLMVTMLGRACSMPLRLSYTGGRSADGHGSRCYYLSSMMSFGMVADVLGSMLLQHRLFYDGLCFGASIE